MQKISFLFLVGLLVVLATMIYLWPDDNLHFVVCDVGQGDALLIQYRFAQLLIDTGKDDAVLSCLSEFMPKWDRHIEVILVTHDDFDHIGGLDDVLAQYDADKILIDKSMKNLKNFLEDGELEIKKDINWQVKKPIFGTKIVLSDTFFGEVISHFEQKNVDFSVQSELTTETTLSDKNLQSSATDNDKEIDNNDRSIVLLFHAGQQKILLMGDLSQKGELALMERNLITKINLIKIGHHGSKTSSSWPFLESSKPEFAIISCGKNNQFGHPNERVLEDLRVIGTKIMRTDELGSFELVTDGEKVWIANVHKED